MDPAKETPIRSPVELQGAMLGRHQEELSAARYAVEGLSAQVTELTNQLQSLRSEPTVIPSRFHSEPRINNPPCYSALLFFEGSTRSCSALIDSGAEGNFIDEDWALQHGVPLQELVDPLPVFALDGSVLSKILCVTIPVSLTISGNHQETITFLVFRSPLTPVVLGHPWLTQHNPQINWVKGIILSWDLSCHVKCLVSAVPAVSSVSVFQEERDDLSRVLREYHDLRAVFSRSRAASLPPHRPYDCSIDLIPGSTPPRGFFFVAKKDGSLRPCIDYRSLNDITIKNHYPLPLMSSAFEILQGAKIFTKLDLRLPSTLINDVLRDMLNIFVFVYLDDILIFSPSISDHVQHSVTFLGHVVSADGISMDLAKVRAVIDWPIPDSRTALQRFLGFAHFYRRFIRNFSQVAAPLTALTSTQTRFVWSELAQEAFDKLKKLFSSTPILITPDTTRQFIVEVDASNVGVGAVLSQRSPLDNRVHPCAFFSHRLSPAKRNYDVGNRKLLAIHLALSEWRHWLEGPCRWGSGLGNRATGQKSSLSRHYPSRLPGGQVIRSRVCAHASRGTLTSVRQRFWWPAIVRDVRRYVASCPVCAQSKSSNSPPAGLLRPLPIPSRPWSHIALDFVSGLPSSAGNTVIRRFLHPSLGPSLFS
ncbi:hypothetical protein M9458_055152 [Cirrhinus mrigala]|uniref:Gypsy retrotransposon integrase-like protein 1 n=1 Tax=Cirrhinus mrigala TaxID=683832 RepID=A0ABD0MKY6_CIRMR